MASPWGLPLKYTAEHARTNQLRRENLSPFGGVCSTTCFRKSKNLLWQWEGPVPSSPAKAAWLKATSSRQGEPDRRRGKNWTRCQLDWPVIPFAEGESSGRRCWCCWTQGCFENNKRNRGKERGLGEEKVKENKSALLLPETQED